MLVHDQCNCCLTLLSAFRTIGWAPHLSGGNQPPVANGTPPLASVAGGRIPPRQARPYSIAERVGGSGAAAGAPVQSQPGASRFSTAPSGGVNGTGGADEFGNYNPQVNRLSSATVTGPGGVALVDRPMGMSTPRIPEEPESSNVTPDSSVGGVNPASPAGPANNNRTSRYAVTNPEGPANGGPYMSALDEKRALAESIAAQDQENATAAAAGGSGAPKAPAGRQMRKGWFSAEQEKEKQQAQQQRYARAKQVAEVTQSAAIAALTAVSSFHLFLSVGILQLNHFGIDYRRLRARILLCLHL